MKVQQNGSVRSKLLEKEILKQLSCASRKRHTFAFSCMVLFSLFWLFFVLRYRRIYDLQHGHVIIDGVDIVLKDVIIGSTEGQEIGEMTLGRWIGLFFLARFVPSLFLICALLCGFLWFYGLRDSKSHSETSGGFFNLRFVNGKWFLWGPRGTDKKVEEKTLINQTAEPSGFAPKQSSVFPRLPTVTRDANYHFQEALQPVALRLNGALAESAALSSAPGPLEEETPITTQNQLNRYTSRMNETSVDSKSNAPRFLKRDASVITAGGQLRVAPIGLSAGAAVAALPANANSGVSVRWGESKGEDNSVAGGTLSDSGLGSLSTDLLLQRAQRELQDAVWATVGVSRPSLAVSQVRSWALDVLRELLRDIDSCDTKLQHRSEVFAMFECAVPLDVPTEAVSQPVSAALKPATSFLFQSANAPAAATTNTQSRRSIIMQHLQQLKQQPASDDVMDLADLLHLRLSLEECLDVASSLPFLASAAISPDVPPLTLTSAPTTTAITATVPQVPTSFGSFGNSGSGGTTFGAQPSGFGQGLASKPAGNTLGGFSFGSSASKPFSSGFTTGTGFGASQAANTAPAPSTAATNSETIAVRKTQRNYVLRRIRALAQQPQLCGYSHQPEGWDVSLPHDSYLLLHIFLKRIPTLFPRGSVTLAGLPHPRPEGASRQPGALTPPPTLCIGANACGPCFFVGYGYTHAGTFSRTLRTSEGGESFFEALVIYAALIKRNKNIRKTRAEVFGKESEKDDGEPSSFDEIMEKSSLGIGRADPRIANKFFSIVT